MATFLEHPLTLTIVTAIIGGIVAVNLKYATSKKDAIDGIKKNIYDVLNYLYIFYILYLLYLDLTSSDTITRITIFSISVKVAILFFLGASHLWFRALKIHSTTLDNQLKMANKLNDVSKQLLSGFNSIQDLSEIQKDHLKMTVENISMTKEMASKKKKK